MDAVILFFLFLLSCKTKIRDIHTTHNEPINKLSRISTSGDLNNSNMINENSRTEVKTGKKEYLAQPSSAPTTRPDNDQLIPKDE